MPSLDERTGTATRLLPGDAFDDLPALWTPAGEPVSHGELRARVAERAASWGSTRSLVMVEGSRDLEQVISYLAALEHGHVALMVSPGRDHDEMLRRWQPDVVAMAGTSTVVHRGNPEQGRHDLHPDLSLLLSTSGSTGSPKLVRLSRTAVLSNAAAIAEYQQLRPDDRAMGTLPLSYCYGLSVLHSHLLVGASMVLSDASVVDPCFWELLDTTRATSLAGVPHTFDLLDRTDFATRGAPSLRRITQAGGRLAPEAVTRWSSVGRAQGWDLFVMYGATEACARMAWLPPDLAETHPGSIGRAIPGGALHVDLHSPDAVPDEGIGELVYTGPNVMMGYASQPQDLARSAELDELRTGDLARERDGLFEVVGRRGRTAKLFGLRLDLPRIERELSSPTQPVTVVAGDAQLFVVLAAPDSTGSLLTRTSTFTGLPTSAVRVVVVPDPPRTANDKLDLAALGRHCQESADGAPVDGATVDGATVEEAGTDPSAGERSLEERILAEHAVVLDRPEAGVEETFVELGGDSLSFVELSVRLERVLHAPPPPGWHLLSSREIARAAAAPASPSTDRPRRSALRGWGSLDTVVALRAAAIACIVASHVDLVDWMGGAHLLLLLVGYNIARFQMALPTARQRATALVRGLAATLTVVVPWMVGVAAATGTLAWSTLFFVHQFGSSTWSDDWRYWFLESLVWLTLGLAALMAVPALTRAERRHPWRFALTLLGVATLVRLVAVGWHAGPVERYSLAGVSFFVALGWLAARADTGPRRLLTAALTLVLVAGFFDDHAREAFVVLGASALIACAHLRLPRVLIPVVAAVASASLAIYVTHWQVYPPLEDSGHPWLALLAALVLGMVWNRAVRPLQRRVQTGRGGGSERPGRTPAPQLVTGQ